MARAHTAAALVAALFLGSSMFGGTVALRLMLLGTALVLTGILAFRPGNDIRLLPPIWLPFLLWGAWALLSLTWSLEPDRTWKEWRNEIFYTGAALWVCYVAAQARRTIRVFVVAITAAGLLAAAISLREFFRGAEHYASGWHGGPGDHSSALLSLMACALGLAWHAMRESQPIYIRLAPWPLIMVLLASAYASLNRTVWLGFAAQFIVIGALALWCQSKADGRPLRLRTMLAATAGAIAIVAVATGVVLHVHATKEGNATAVGPKRDSRLEVWREVSARVAERPLLGHGFGRGIQRDAIRESLGGSGNLWHAHNIFLDAALQTGLVGVCLFLLLLGKALQEGWRLASCSDTLAAACGVALMCLLTGMLVRNMTDTLLVRQNALLFWGLAAFFLAVGARSLNRRATAA
jgi:O-antigen ligase